LDPPTDDQAFQKCIDRLRQSGMFDFVGADQMSFCTSQPSPGSVDSLILEIARERVASAKEQQSDEADRLQRETSDAVETLRQRQESSDQELEETKQTLEETKRKLAQTKREVDKQRELIEQGRHADAPPTCEQRVRANLDEVQRDSLMADRLVAAYCR
jgi:hypothetical protein